MTTARRNPPMPAHLMRQHAEQTPTAYRAAIALNQAADELRSAMTKFPPFNSAHEGYAVLLEEVDELWHEVKHGTRERMREEAVQVAAMALRFLVDVHLVEDPFGTTCIDCGKPIDDTQPYANTDDGNLMHVECGEPCVCHTAFTCLAHDHDEQRAEDDTPEPS